MAAQSNFTSFSLWVFKAWRSFWLKAFDYKSRTTRSEFWCVLALNLITSLLLGLTFFIHGNLIAFFAIMAVWAFALVVPNISISMRRLRICNSIAWALVFPLGRTFCFSWLNWIDLRYCFCIAWHLCSWLFAKPSLPSEVEKLQELQCWPCWGADWTCSGKRLRHVPRAFWYDLQ